MHCSYVSIARVSIAPPRREIRDTRVLRLSGTIIPVCNLRGPRGSVPSIVKRPIPSPRIRPRIPLDDRQTPASANTKKAQLLLLDCASYSQYSIDSLRHSSRQTPVSPVSPAYDVVFLDPYYDRHGLVTTFDPAVNSLSHAS